MDNLLIGLLGFCLGGLFIGVNYPNKPAKIIEVGEKSYIYRLKSLYLWLKTTRKIVEDYLTKEPFDDEKLVKLVERFEYQENQIAFLLREQKEAE